MFIPFAILAFVIGLVIASFLLLSAWFAWTPMPLVGRMPLVIGLVSPFGFVVSTLEADWRSGLTIGTVLGLLLFSGIVADRSASYAGCLLVFLLFVVLPVLLGLIYQPGGLDRIRYQTFGMTICLLLLLSLVCWPLRWFRFRIERLSAFAGDERSHLMTGKTIDQWIDVIDQECGVDATFAQAMSLVRGYGIDELAAKMVVKSAFRAIGKSAPRIIDLSAENGMSAWLQWATTGPACDQYSVRQLMLWVASAAILFAFLSRTGMDHEAIAHLLASLPWTVGAGLSVTLLADFWLSGRPCLPRILSVGGGTLCLAAAFGWLTKVDAFTANYGVLIPFGFFGTLAWLNYWMFHIRREGFRLTRT